MGYTASERFREGFVKLFVESNIGIDCPHDGNVTFECEFEGIKIDICPSCSGIWFDTSEYKEALLKFSELSDRRIKEEREGGIVYLVLETLTLFLRTLAV